jgi:hypothetical protein
MINYGNDWKQFKRGDSLGIVIYKSEQKDINSMYFKCTLAGLATKDKLIFTPEEARLLDKDTRKNNLWMTSIAWIVIFIVLVIVRINKSSE